MVWTAVTKFGRGLLFFVDQGVKLNQQYYIDDILVGVLLPWTREHFKTRPWSFQQDSASSHEAKKTKEWLSENIPHFITKEEWAASSPNLNLLDFGIWSYLESKVSTVNHQSFETLKVKLRKEWAKIPQKVIRDSCKAFSKRLQLVIDADGGYIQWYFGNCLSKPYSTQIHLKKFSILFHFIVITTLICNDKYWWLCIHEYTIKYNPLRFIAVHRWTPSRIESLYSWLNTRVISPLLMRDHYK